MQHRFFAAMAAAVALSIAVDVAGAQVAAAQDAGPSRARASDVLVTIERSASRIQHLLGETRASGDATRAGCVDLRLSQITATLRLALERSHRAMRYEERGDRTMAARERALIARLAGHVRTLEHDARRCVDPEGEIAPNRTRVTVVIDPSVPRDALVDPVADRRSPFFGR